MLKRFLLCLAVVGTCSTSVFAQDFFVSFDPASAQDTTSAGVGTTGSAYIFGDLSFAFDAADIKFTSSDSSVLQFAGTTVFQTDDDPDTTDLDESLLPTFTGGEGIDDVFNAPFNTGRFNASFVTRDRIGDLDPVVGADNITASVDSGSWFAARISGTNGISPGFAPFDPNSIAGVGNLLARVDYNVVGAGVSELGLNIDTGQGVILLGVNGGADTVLTPTFASGTLTAVAVPEPSSAVLLALGFAGFAARRRR